METGHFLKMLNDASLASLEFLMWKVLGCIICKNPLWVLSCKVNPLRCQTNPLVKDNIVGGPAIIFHRHHEKDVTKIRGEEKCRSIVGYDANALYLLALMQDMPTGWYTRRREEKQFRPQQAQPSGQMAVQWLTWESAKN